MTDDRRRTFQRALEFCYWESPQGVEAHNVSARQDPSKQGMEETTPLDAGLRFSSCGAYRDGSFGSISLEDKESAILTPWCYRKWPVHTSSKKAT